MKWTNNILEFHHLCRFIMSTSLPLRLVWHEKCASSIYVSTFYMLLIVWWQMCFLNEGAWTIILSNVLSTLKNAWYMVWLEAWTNLQKSVFPWMQMSFCSIGWNAWYRCIIILVITPSVWMPSIKQRCTWRGCFNL